MVYNKLMISPTAIMLDNINLSKRETRAMIKAGGLDCLTLGVLSLMESAGAGDMKAADLVINRIDGLITDRVEIKPIIVEVVNYGSDD
jgi:hypothetical protein